MTDNEKVERVLLQEQERIRALLGKNHAALKAMLDERLVHVHTTGRLEDYHSYLAGVTNNLEFLSIDRGALAVRIVGSVAIMTGPLDQHLRIKATDSEMTLASIATQVWVEAGDAWKLISFHACPRG